MGKYPKFEKVFGYDHITGEAKIVNKKSVAEMNDIYNKAWGVMTTDRYLQLKREINKKR